MITKYYVSGLVKFGISVYLVYIVIAIYTKRSFFADGALTFLNIVNENMNNPSILFISNDYSVNRMGVNALIQLLTIIACKIGVKDINALQIFSRGFPKFSLL